MINKKLLQRCPGCDKEKEINEFAPRARNTKSCPCKECIRIRGKMYRKNNKKKIIKREKKCRESNIEKNKNINPYNDKTSKRCPRCSTFLPRTKFLISLDKTDGLSSHCKICSTIRSGKYIHDGHLITRQDVEKLYKYQDGKCAICQTDFAVAFKDGFYNIDHCHNSKEIRGLLCSTCNLTIMGKIDNGYHKQLKRDLKPAIYNRAIEYKNNSRGQ